MNTSFNNIVNRAEQDALKEMIFRRAKERAEALANDVQTTYTSNMKHDIMDLARETIRPERNPFAQQLEVQKAPEAEKIVEKPIEKDENIGFAPRKNNEIINRIKDSNKIYNEVSTSKEIIATMNSAREQLENKKTFMGALNFLNSQATISLVSSKGKTFDAIA